MKKSNIITPPGLEYSNSRRIQNRPAHHVLLIKTLFT